MWGMCFLARAKYWAEERVHLFTLHPGFEDLIVARLQTSVTGAS